jgi:hypothetical protein
MEMRQGPHKRSRTRGRRPTSNMSGRVYESNGPDVKVRGTAQTVADKYLQLARDAHSAGDTVMAEGYFQHAEHYLRILAAAQPQSQQNEPQRRNDQYSYDDGDDQGGDEEQSAAVSSGGTGNGETQPRPRVQPQPPQQAQPQPEQEPAKQPTADAAGSDSDGEQPWGGPEPEFLRRGPQNGSGRPRRTRQPRSGNGRNDTAAGSDGNDEVVPVAEDTPEQTS